MTSREQFISTVSKALGRSELTPPDSFVYRHTVQTDVMKDLTKNELARLFIEYSKTIGADVFETTRKELTGTIKRAVDLCKSGDVVVADDPLLNELDVAHQLKLETKVRVWDVQNVRDKNVNFAEKATVGIAVAKMALAESGTVLLFCGGGCGRSVTLLPEATIYIIPQSCIQPRLTQAMSFIQQQQERLPSSINFVSGPSATSDIELVRVVGVHGPVHVVHVVVTDM